MNPVIIGLLGLKLSGKSTVAEYLIRNYGMKLLNFSDPLNNMLKAIGITDSELETDCKNEPCPWLGGNSPASAMDSLRFEWGGKIHPDLWANIWKARVQESKSRFVIVDDIKTFGELQTIKDLKGLIIKIEPSYPGYIEQEPTENVELPADKIVYNSATIKDVCEQVSKMIFGV